MGSLSCFRDIDLGQFSGILGSIVKIKKKVTKITDY